MQTTVNVSQAQEATDTRMRREAPGVCAFMKTRKSGGGSNIEFGQRSVTVVNKKDRYGFRSMSPFRAVYRKRIQPAGSTNYTMENYPCETYYKLTGYPGGIEKWHRNMLDRMTVLGSQDPKLLAMRAEADLKQQDINLLLFAAFLPSTLRNISENLRKMDSLLDILHDKRKLMQHFKGTEWKSLYLQWLFVWNQLHRDVVGGAAFLKKQSRPIGSLVTGRARAEWTSQFEDEAFPYTSKMIGRSVCKTNVTVSQRAVSIARVSCDVSYTHNALGIDNPAYLLWDLIRWSWVVDQIVDIGLFIQSISSLHGLEFLGTSVTTRSVNVSTVSVEPHTVGSTAGRREFCNPSYSTGSSFYKTVDRRVSDNPTRAVTVRNPFQNSIAVTAAVAAAIGLKMQRDVDIDVILRHAR